MSKKQPTSTNPTTTERVRLRRVAISNYQRLRAVVFDVAPGINDLSGRCAQGKSSVPQAIQEALVRGGVSSKPIREGADRATIKLGFDDGSTVTKTITPSKSTVEHIAPDGQRGGISSLEGWITEELFNPLAFRALSSSKPGRRTQVEIIADISGYDSTQKDARRALLVTERTEIGRQRDDVRAQAEAVVVPDMPEEIGEEVSPASIRERLKVAQEAKRRNDDQRAQVKHLEAAEERASRAVTEAEEEVAEIERRLLGARAKVERLRATRTTAGADLLAAQERVAELVDPPLADIEREQDVLEERNRIVRERKQQAAAAKAEMERLEALALKVRQFEAAYERHTESIRQVDADLAADRARAKMPLPGIEIRGTGPDREVYYQGQPFSQSSGSEALLVGCAIGLARNPRLGLLWLDYGDALDAKMVEALQRFLAEHDADAFVIHVVDDPKDGVGLVIDDGQILEDRRTPMPQPAPDRAPPRRATPQPPSTPPPPPPPKAAKTKGPPQLTLVTSREDVEAPTFDDEAGEDDFEPPAEEDEEEAPPGF